MRPTCSFSATSVVLLLMGIILLLACRVLEPYRPTLQRRGKAESELNLLLNHLNTPMLHPLLWPPPTERSIFHVMLVYTVVPSAVPSSWLVFLLFRRLSCPVYLLNAVSSGLE